jgi:Zn-dependent protease with chaperone function
VLGARPDDTCFFATVTLVTAMLSVIPPHGLVTLAWGLEGLVVFLVALWAGERKYRLTGLGLLLLCVARIGIDVWAISAQERWITLVVLGALLMLVSFLYSRYREMLRRYL